jgi:hypothetical protein
MVGRDKNGGSAVPLAVRAPVGWWQDLGKEKDEREKGMRR